GCEEEDVSATLQYWIEIKRAAAMQRPVLLFNCADYLRGGICRSSVICSLVSGFSRNFSFTASRIAPSRSANLSVCSVSFGWNFSIESLSRSTGKCIFWEYISTAFGSEYIQSTDSRYACMKRMIASCFVFNELAFTISVRTVCPRSEGTSLPCATMRILPSLSSFKPNGGAAQPMSIWPDITAVSVAAGPPVAVGLALAPSSLTNATTMLFELDPLVE